MRHFYAARHFYDVRFSNDYGTLFRFDTAAERDEFVAESRFDEASTGNVRTEALTRGKARRHFPNAFRTVGDTHEQTDERDWLDGATDTSAYWHADNIYYH